MGGGVQLEQVWFTNEADLHSRPNAFVLGGNGFRC